MPALKLCNSLD